MKTKEFFKLWINGMKNLSATELQRTKSYVILGQIFGIVFAMVVMFYKSLWYWEIFMFFFLIMQFLDYIQTRQRLKAILNITEQIKEMEVEKNGH